MINYEDLAYNSTVDNCRTPVVKDCDIPGETVCQTIYESECATVQIVHEVGELKLFGIFTILVIRRWRMM